MKECNTQKVITTQGTNTYIKTIVVRKCSEPDDKLKQIYDTLKITHKPFRKRKSVVHKKPTFKTETQQNQLLMSG